MGPSNVRIEETIIRTLAGGEAPMVGDVIADSYADYPAFTHLFPDPSQRRRVLRRTAQNRPIPQRGS